MPTETSTDEQWLGEIETRIAGSQYCDSEAETGETISLERDPRNVHDPNAIRLENKTFEKIGYLPRRVASWLAPLMDDGRVMADAVAGTTALDQDLPPVALKLYLSHKGLNILELTEDPKTAAEAIHRTVTETFLASGGWTRSVVVDEAGLLLSSLHKGELLAETRMLLSLFPYQAKHVHEARTKAVLSRARDSVKALELREPVSFGNLTLFPVYGPGGVSYDCSLLKTGLESGEVVVTEVSESGEVSELTVQNNGPRSILIPEGEILTGGKQDRVVNITVLVAASSIFTLPVSCVEQGRWSTESEGFEATHYAPHSLRASKNEGVLADRGSGGVGHSDQGQVWGDIADTTDDMDLSSDTDSLPETYEQVEEFLVGYRENLTVPPDCNGVLLAVDGEISGMDYFDNTDAFAWMWPALSQAYFFEAIRIKGTGVVSTDQARSYLATMADALSVADRTPGESTELYLSGGGLTGSGVAAEGRLIHLTASTNRRWHAAEG